MKIKSDPAPFAWARSLIPAVLCLVMVACAADAEKRRAEPRTIELVGGITVSYTKDGEFRSISSRAVSEVIGNLTSSRSEAVTVATLKARRQIAEFLRSSVSSERLVTQVSDSLQSQQTNKDLSLKIAREVREEIRQKSRAILKGTYVKNVQYEETAGIVTVTVEFDVKAKGAVDTLQKWMR
jgi:hypothetical protein